MRRYWNITITSIRNAIIRDSKITGQIMTNVTMQALEILIAIIFFSVIYDNTDTLAGWSFYQLLFLYSYIKAVATFHSFLTKKGTNSIANELIRLGDFDFYITKPVNSMFFVSISKPRAYSLLAWIFEIGLMIYAVVKGNFDISLVNILWFIILTIFAEILFYFLQIIVVIPAFWLVRLFSLSDLMNRLTQFGRYPAGILPRLLQAAFYTAIPIFFLSYVPVKTLLFTIDYRFIVASFVITIAFGFLTNYLWRLGVRHYGSASS